MKKILLTLCVLFMAFAGYAQQKKIKILWAEHNYANEEKFPGAIILDGKVKIAHEGAILTCRRAFYYKKENFLKAIGNVIINQGDTIHQNSDYVDYDLTSKKAVSWGNVVLKDPKMTLKTDTLYFDRLNQKLFYKDHATIQDETNILKSKNGNYYLETKKFTATTQVTITNPDNIIESQHLDYYTSSGHAYLYGPSTIINKEDGNKIYSERGFYNTKTDISHFVKNAKLYLDDRTIEGDSLYYDKNRGFASATNNIRVIDTAQNFIAKGNYAEYFEKLDSIFMIKKAVAISVMEKDSMFVHGDTLLVTGKKEKRIIRTFNNVKIFKSDLQGKCDSLHTDQATGVTKMYFSPILWSEKSQITGDSIKLLSDKKTDKLDSLKILGNSFIIQQDSLDPKNFNQIKGKNMYGKFIENKLRTLLVKGNGEAVNYNRNDNGVLETISKQFCSNIEFVLENNEIDQIKCMKQTDGTTFPPSKFPEADRKLKGFLWREDEQPKTKEDIFIKDGKPARKPLFKGNPPATKKGKKSVKKKEKSNP
ncbi:OstA-like protein [Pseudotenacibaculum haliotis]|uniref:OstA-like protein n=1 Tax=Pseudotenacibaculum haliotis TaxID=1862138 RepID=A0ABW5LTG3_9FLAO